MRIWILKGLYGRGRCFQLWKHLEEIYDTFEEAVKEVVNLRKSGITLHIKVAREVGFIER